MKEKVKGATEKFITDNFIYSDGTSIGSIKKLRDRSLAVTFVSVKLKETNELGVLIDIPNRVSTNTIAHEATHFAIAVFADLDIKVEMANDEHLAYLIGWCADCIEQVLKNKFKEM